MTDAADRLRSAADHIDDARTDLEYGDLEGPSDETSAVITDLDDTMETMMNSLRELAIGVEVVEEADTHE